jgi:imidazolonepropionase-like amidohydrolase
VTTFTEPELRAAVEAAENWGTYVTVHAFTPAAIQRAIAAGVKCIEHGFLMDEATAKLIAEKGVWLSLQPLPEELRQGFPVGSVQRAKADDVWPGIARTYELAKKYKIKTAWGTDVLFSQALAQRQGAILASLVRWYSPPKHSQWQPEPTPNCWHCSANAVRILASSASWSGAPLRICCWSTAIHWRIST